MLSRCDLAAGLKRRPICRTTQPLFNGLWRIRPRRISSAAPLWAGWSSVKRQAKAKSQTGDATPSEELRDYGVGAQILTELGVHDMILLTNTHHTLVALEGYGLSIIGERPID